MGLDDDFNEAVEVVKYLGEAPKDDELLEVYALYQQATVGDCNTAKPGMLDFKGKAKWDAWNGKKGTSQDDAKKAYVDKAEALFLAYGFKVYFPNWGKRPSIWAKWLKSGQK